MSVEGAEAPATSGAPRTIDYCEPVQILAIHGYDDKGKEFSRLGFELDGQFFAFQSAVARKSITVPLAVPWLVGALKRAQQKRELVLSGTTSGADVKTSVAKVGGVSMADLSTEEIPGD